MMLNPVMEQNFSVALTVSELNANIKSLIENAYPFVWVKGEISNLRIPSSGHFYFTLKDERSQIKAVLFKAYQRNVRFNPEPGLQVICQGRLGVYEPRGEYQLIVEVMEAQGIGSLQLAFDQLKKKLEEEGLFHPSGKRALPQCPSEIAIVTSPTGAAIQDMLKVFTRCPCPISITLFPVRVQGQEACGEIAAAIQTATSLAERYEWDLIIIGRGGGSIEDLWPFNEEIVARALKSCCVPNISAVGHEIDYTISDLVADYRAPTPTAAAEWVVSQLDRFLSDISKARDMMLQAVLHEINAARQKLELLRRGLIDPRRKLEDSRMLLDERTERLYAGMRRHIERFSLLCKHLAEKVQLLDPGSSIERYRTTVSQSTKALVGAYQNVLGKHRLELQDCSSRLEALNPLSVLNRGYSITYRVFDGQVIRKSTEVGPGEDIHIRLSEGSLECTVKRIDSFDERPASFIQGAKKQ